MPHLGAPSSSLASDDEDQVPVCATCEVEVPWTPVQHAGKAFCCAGCAAGGPCTCSYDDFNAEDSFMMMTNTIPATRASPRVMPMTRDVLRRLQKDAERLIDELPRLQAQARENGVSGDPESPTVLAAADLHLAARRLEMLRRVIEDAHIVEPDGRIVIGSRVTVRHADGESETYELVAPGEADTRLGRITPDSPLGAALLLRRADEVAHIDAPKGRVELAITSVSAPAPVCEIPTPVADAEERLDIVYEQSLQSFPTSDAPSWTGASI